MTYFLNRKKEKKSENATEEKTRETSFIVQTTNKLYSSLWKISLLVSVSLSLSFQLGK